MQTLVRFWMRLCEMAICVLVLSLAASQNVKAADKEDTERLTPVIQGGAVVAMQKVGAANPEEPTIVLEDVPVPEKHPLREVLGPILSHTNPHITLHWRLYALNGRCSNLNDNDMAYVALLPDLEVLILNNTKITDKGLSHVLRRLTRLREVDVSETRITDKAIAHLKNQKNLRNLGLDGTDITDNGLRQLDTLRDLRTLKLRGAGISDAGLAVLRDMPDLRNLYLSRTSVGDEGLRFVGKLKNLELLALDRTRVSDVGIAQLKESRNLESLDLDDTAVSTLEPLKGLPKLAYLSLFGTRVNDKSVGALASLPRLAVLSLVNTKITDEGMKQFAGMKSLTQLNLNGTMISDAGLRVLKDCPALREVSVYGTKVTVDEARRFARENPSISVENGSDGKDTTPGPRRPYETHEVTNDATLSPICTTDKVLALCVLPVSPRRMGMPYSQGRAPV